MLSTESPTLPVLSDTPSLNNLEATNNYLNLNFHSIPTNDSVTLPRYADTHNTMNNELNEKNERMDLSADNSQQNGKETHLSQNENFLLDKEAYDQHDNNKTESVCDGNDPNVFTYKTINGGIIRSVHPPGKGNSACYKV